MQITDRSPDDYLAELEPKFRNEMRELDTLVTNIFAGHSRVMWEGIFWGGTEQSTIGYGDLIQQRPKGADVHWFMVGLALQKSGPSLYVNAVVDGQYIGKVYAERLGKVKIGSASIGLRKLEDVNMSALTQLLQEARSQLG